MSVNDKAAREAKLARRKQAEDEQAKKSRSFRTKVIIVIVAVVLVVAAALVITSDLFYTAFPAVTVNGTSYNAAEVNVFYRSAYNTFYNYYTSQLRSLFGSDADVSSYFTSFTGLDTSKALDEQEYIEGQTWADYFMEQALSNMEQVTALCDAAKQAGYTLPQEALDEIEADISSLTSTGALNGYGADQFVALNYGKGVNVKVLRSVMEKMELASHYAEQVNDDRSYTDEQVESYYAEHADEYDVIGYYSFLLSSSNDAFAEVGADIEDEDEAAHAKVHAALDAAEEIAASGDLESFLAACAEYGTEPTARYTAGSSLASALSEWLLSADRKAGDATAIETDSGAYALWFLDRDGNDYNTRSFRHILIQAEADEEGNYSDEAIFAAEARIREIEAEWKEDPTEEHFIELANQYSEDEGSNTNGGLYEDVEKHSMVADIDAFLFAEGRQAGDTAVVEGDNGSYHGWHLVYYVGETERNIRYDTAEPALRSEEQDAWLESVKEGYSAVKASGLKFVKVS